MDLYIYVLVKDSQEEGIEFVTGVATDRVSRLRAYASPSGARRAKTLLAKRGIKASIVELSVKDGDWVA